MGGREGVRGDSGTWGTICSGGSLATTPLFWGLTHPSTGLARRRRDRVGSPRSPGHLRLHGLGLGDRGMLGKVPILLSAPLALTMKTIKRQIWPHPSLLGEAGSDS